ncbi:MAG: hypothetical protein JXQ87_16925 [Bacteroidia bacterium]
MKQLKLAILLLLVSISLFAQDEKKPVALVFNNGLGSAGISFSYFESLAHNAQLLELNSGTTSPFVANPGLRFYTKRGYNEIGFNNILIGGRGEGVFDNSQNLVSAQVLSLFASSVYFNKSIRVRTIMGGDLFACIEPTFNYSTISKGFQREYDYIGRNLGADFKFLLRWDHFFKENAFVSLVGGLSPFEMNMQMIEHRLTDFDNPIFINEARFNWRFSQVVQLTFGILI